MEVILMEWVKCEKRMPGHRQVVDVKTAGGDVLAGCVYKSAGHFFNNGIRLYQNIISWRNIGGTDRTKPDTKVEQFQRRDPEKESDIRDK